MAEPMSPHPDDLVEIVEDDHDHIEIVETPESESAASDPRASAPWYQRALRLLRLHPTTEAERRARYGAEHALRQYFQPPPEVEKAERDAARAAWNRFALEVVFPTMVAAGLPVSSAWSPLLRASPLYQRFLAAAEPVAKAATEGMAQYLGTAAANVVDPQHFTPPVATAAPAAALSYIFGRIPASLFPRLSAQWQPDREGQIVSATLTRLAPGQIQTPGMISGSPAIQATERVLQRFPFSRPLREAYDRAQEVVDIALKSLRARLPGGETRQTAEQLVHEALRPLRITPRGGEVGTAVDDLMHTALQPFSAHRVGGQTYPRVVEQLTSVGTAADPMLLETVPAAVQTRVHKALYETKRFLDEEVYRPLDRAIQETPLDISGLKPRVARLGLMRAAPQEHREAAAEVVGLLKALPETITLDQLQTVYQRLRDVPDAAVRGLAQVRADLEQLLTTRLVDVRPLKAAVAPDLAAFERFPVSEASLKAWATGQQFPGEDVHVQFMRAVQALPDFIPFQEAQLLRSKAGEMARARGESVGNTLADRGHHYAEVLRQTMGDTADRLGTQGLRQQWREADRQYHEAAQLWNSRLLTDLLHASQDDILRYIVRNERPNDMRTLRNVLGDELWDQVGRMWLTRQLLAARDPVTGHVRPGVMQQALTELTPIAEREVFPQGLHEIRRAMQKAAAMEWALTEADPAKLTELRQVIGDDTLWDAVRRDRLARMVARSTDPATGLPQASQLKHALDAMPSGLRTALYPHGELEVLRGELGRLAALEAATHTSDGATLQRLARSVEDPQLWRLVQQDWYAREIAPLLHPAGGVDLDALYAKMQSLKADVTKRRALFPEGELDALIPQVEKAYALQKAPHAQDVTEVLRYKRIINDPALWQQVSREWLGAGLQIDQQTGLVSGRHLLAYLDKQPSLTRAMLEPEVVRELRHFGLTAERLAAQRPTRAAPLVQLTEFGNVVIGGLPTYRPGVVASGTGLVLSLAQLSRVLTNPTLARWLTTGMHTPQGTRQAAEVAGVLLGALGGEGLFGGPGDTGVIEYDPARRTE